MNSVLWVHEEMLNPAVAAALPAVFVFDIERIEPVGHYAVVLEFSDKHNSGIYSWDYLYDLGANYEAKWADYLRRLEAAGASRVPADHQYN